MVLEAAVWISYFVIVQQISCVKSEVLNVPNFISQTNLSALTTDSHNITVNNELNTEPSNDALFSALELNSNNESDNDLCDSSQNCDGSSPSSSSNTKIPPSAPKIIWNRETILQIPTTTSIEPNTHSHVEESHSTISPLDYIPPTHSTGNFNFEENELESEVREVNDQIHTSTSGRKGSVTGDNITTLEMTSNTDSILGVSQTTDSLTSLSSESSVSLPSEIGMILATTTDDPSDIEIKTTMSPEPGTDTVLPLDLSETTTSGTLFATTDNPSHIDIKTAMPSEPVAATVSPSDLGGTTTSGTLFAMTDNQYHIDIKTAMSSEPVTDTVSPLELSGTTSSETLFAMTDNPSHIDIKTASSPEPVIVLSSDLNENTESSILNMTTDDPSHIDIKTSMSSEAVTDRVLLPVLATKPATSIHEMEQLSTYGANTSEMTDSYEISVDPNASTASSHYPSDITSLLQDSEISMQTTLPPVLETQNTDINLKNVTVDVQNSTYALESISHRFRESRNFDVNTERTDFEATFETELRNHSSTTDEISDLLIDASNILENVTNLPAVSHSLTTPKTITPSIPEDTTIAGKSSEFTSVPFTISSQKEFIKDNSTSMTKEGGTVNPTVYFFTTRAGSVISINLVTFNTGEDFITNITFETPKHSTEQTIPKFVTESTNMTTEIIDETIDVNSVTVTDVTNKNTQKITETVSENSASTESVVTHATILYPIAEIDNEITISSSPETKQTTSVITSAENPDIHSNTLNVAHFESSTDALPTTFITDIITNTTSVPTNDTIPTRLYPIDYFNPIENVSDSPSRNITHLIQTTTSTPKIENSIITGEPEGTPVVYTSTESPEYIDIIDYPTTDFPVNATKTENSTVLITVEMSSSTFPAIDPTKSIPDSVSTVVIPESPDPIDEIHREGKHIPFSTTKPKGKTDDKAINGVIKVSPSIPKEAHPTVTSIELPMNLRDYEELSTEEKLNVMTVFIQLPHKYNSEENINKSTLEFRRWIDRIILTNYENIMANASVNDSTKSSEKPFTTVYIRPAPEVHFSNITFAFFAYSNDKNKTLPAALLLPLFESNKEELKIIVNAEASYFQQGINSDHFDFLKFLMNKHGMIVFITSVVAALLIIILIIIVIFYRRKNHFSAHFLTTNKVHRNMQETIGLDLNPALIILQDELKEKALNGNKICLDDNECCVVPFTDVPLAEDKDAPRIQDTKL